MNTFVRTIVIFVAVLAAVFIGKEGFKFFYKSPTNTLAETVLSQNWNLREIGTTNIGILAPENMSDVSNAAETGLSNIKQEVYQFSLGTFGFSILYAETDNNTISGKDYSTKLAEKIKTSGAAQSFSYEIKASEVNKIPGWLLSGVVKSTEGNIRIESFAFSIEQHLWNIALSFEDSDEELKEFSLKVINSLTILKN